jgi:hypothetical protein
MVCGRIHRCNLSFTAFWQTDSGAARAFLANKFDASKGRGNEDYLLSKDMEDYIP